MNTSSTIVIKKNIPIQVEFVIMQNFDTSNCAKHKINACLKIILHE